MTLATSGDEPVTSRFPTRSEISFAHEYAPGISRLFSFLVARVCLADFVLLVAGERIYALPILHLYVLFG